LNNAELRKWKMPFGGRLNPEWVAGFTGIRNYIIHYLSLSAAF